MSAYYGWGRTRSWCVEVSLDGPVRRWMGALGLAVARHPAPFFVLPLLLTAALAYPFLRGYDSYRSRGAVTSVELFTPSGSDSFRWRDEMAAHFPDGGYFSDRSFASPNLLLLIVGAKDGGSVLRSHIVADFALLRRRLETEPAVRSNVSNFGYRELCAFDVFGKHCRRDPLLALWGSAAAASLTYPLQNFTSAGQTRTEYIGPLFGGVATDARGRVFYTRYVKMIFDLPPMPPSAPPDLLKNYGEEWGREVRAWQSLEGLSSPLSVRYWSGVQQRRDLGLIGERTRRLLPLLVSLLLLFSLGSAFMLDPVLSKPWLAVSGVVSAGCGLVVGYALLFIANVSLIQIATIVPFLVLSIGVDDTFVMLNIWRGTERHLRVEERMQQTFQDSGVSIVITTLTDAGVFALGVTSEFPAIRRFCAFAAVSIVVVFAFQVTFFGACLALSARREAANRHCIFFTKVKDYTGNVCCYRYPVIDRTKYYSDFVTQSVVQGFVGASYLVYVAVATYCFINRLQVGLQISTLVPYDSDSHAYLSIYERYFTRFSTQAEVMIMGPVEYENEETQRLLLDLAEGIGGTPWTLRPDFWLDQFLLAHPRPFPNPAAFYHTLLTQFLRQAPSHRYAADVKFIERADGNYFINSSRFFVPLMNMGMANRSQAMSALKAEVERGRLSGLPLRVHHVGFPLAEQMDAILPGVAMSMGLAALGMLLVALVFIPCIRSCLAVSLTVVSINVGVLGFLGLWTVRLDIISTITILLSIGFSVDYAAHITYHLYHSKGKRGDERLRNALGTVGWPILQSSISTLVGVVSVVGVGGYVSEVFVKTVVLVVGLGLYHGLLILPVLLSILSDGRKLCTVDDKDSEYYYAEPTGTQFSSSQSGLSAPTTMAPRVPLPEPPRVVAVPSPPPPSTPLSSRVDSGIASANSTMRVDSAWLDSWLHGDIKCVKDEGKYCAYCTTKDEIMLQTVEIKCTQEKLRSVRSAKSTSFAAVRPDPKVYTSFWK